eukprot:tig00020849_g14671.t1
MLDALGGRGRARALLDGVGALAERLGGGLASMSVCHQRGMQLCREGRFTEGVEAFARTVGLGGDHPDNLNNRSSLGLALLLTGNLAASERTYEEAATFNSRLGLSETFVATCTARSRATLSEERIGRAWYMQTTGLAGAVLLPILLCDFALWWLDSARAAEAEAEAGAGAGRARRPAPPAGLWGRLCGRSRARGGPRVDPWQLDPAAPAPAPAPALPAELSDVRRAEAFARRAAALLSEASRRRLSALAPFVELAAAHLGRPGRRAGRLRAARDAFGRSGLRPWEAAAGLQLARWAGDAAEAAAASEAAARVAREAGLRAPLAAGESGPSPAAVVSLWV